MKSISRCSTPPIARSKPQPPLKSSAMRYLYSDRIDPASDEFESEPNFSGEPRTMVDEINLHAA